MKTMTMNKVFSTLFLVLGIAAIYGVIISRAWWHIGTAVICWVMFKAFRSADDDPDKEDPYIEE